MFKHLPSELQIQAMHAECMQDPSKPRLVFLLLEWMRGFHIPSVGEVGRITGKRRKPREKTKLSTNRASRIFSDIYGGTVVKVISPKSVLDAKL